ncbi:MAG: hypothetical protein FWG88_11100 [Oscillospiraceae bacterium]|nr:hypothetical protein [Oscillospiraceae bacterium]
MNLKKSAKNILQPAMERMGFELKESYPNYVSYRGDYDESTREYTLGVIIDIEPFFSRLRVKLLFRDAFYMMSGFGIETFSKYKDLKLYCESQEELDYILRTITDILENFAIQYVIEFRDNYVYRHKDMQYNRLIPPEKQAEDFANANKLPMKYEAASFLNLEKRIDQMRGDSMSNWRENFAKHQDEILRLSLYCGELYRKHDSSLEWTLGPYNHYIIESNKPTIYPLIDVIGYWNNGLDTETSLVPRELRVKPKEEPRIVASEPEKKELNKEEIAAIDEVLFRDLPKERVEYLLANYPIDSPNDLVFYDEEDKRKNRK